jgi:hypothetical protein
MNVPIKIKQDIKVLYLPKDRLLNGEYEIEFYQNGLLLSLGEEYKLVLRDTKLYAEFLYPNDGDVFKMRIQSRVIDSSNFGAYICCSMFCKRFHNKSNLFFSGIVLIDDEIANIEMDLL